MGWIDRQTAGLLNGGRKHSNARVSVCVCGDLLNVCVCVCVCAAASASLLTGLFTSVLMLHVAVGGICICGLR